MSNTAHLRLVEAGPLALRFGRFEWQPQERQLLADGQPAAVRGKAQDVLAVLIERAGQLVSRQALMTLVWADVIVEENNLSVQINALRKVLGGDVIVTVPGRGYRFTLPVERGSAGVPLRAVGLQPAPAVATQAALRSNLPELPAPLVGRDVDLAALAALLAQHRLVTVLGAAGMGKTRLAQAALHAARGGPAHGVCFVELALLRAGDAVIATVAAALGLPQPAGADPMAGLLQVLAPLQMLLALDNAEHVLPAVAALVAVLRDGAPGVRIVVTSQAPLGLAEERLFRLGPLAVPPTGPTAWTAQAVASFGAVALFALRAQARDTRFAVTDANVAQVVELCTRLDGAPLAIELAAARASHLGLSALLAGLDQRLAMLTGGRRDAPQRHQTLRAALQWSHDLLSPVEQAVFRRFAVFVGGAALDEVLAVVADTDEGADSNAVTDAAPAGIDRWAALDALGTLIDRSLIEQMPGAAACPAAAGAEVANTARAADAADAAPRYRLLDTPRAFAREQMRAAGEQALMQQRHALAMRSRYARAREDLLGGRLGFDAWRTELDLDIDNGLAAAAWAAQHDAETAWVIATGLSRNIYGRRHTDCKAIWQAVEPLLDAALVTLAAAPPSAPAAPSPWLARALCECAVFWTNHRPSHARLRADQALPLARASGDTQMQCLALARIAWLCSDEETLPEFQQISTELSALCRADWPVFVQTEIHQHDWLHAHMAGDFDGALAELRLQAARHADCGYTDTSPYGNMVMVLIHAGRLDEAIAQSRALLDRFVGKRHQGPSRHLLNNLAGAHLAQDDTVQARAVQQALWPLAVSHDMLRHWSCNAALLAALEQRPRAALALLAYSDAATEKAAPGMPRQGSEQRMVERTLTLARTALGGAGFAAAEAQLKAQGAALSEAALLALALGHADPSGGA
jgi:predicted ATPase/DNA-binding winged helix-turn-helix (wHTH) protein